MWQHLRHLASSVRLELAVYRAVAKHPRTPLLARASLALAIGYLILPFDVIPDFIPVIGHIDDLIIVPALVAFALRLAPPEVIAECRAKCSTESSDGDSNNT